MAESQVLAVLLRTECHPLAARPRAAELDEAAFPVEENQKGAAPSTAEGQAVEGLPKDEGRPVTVLAEAVVAAHKAEDRAVSTLTKAEGRTVAEPRAAHVTALAAEKL